MWCDSAGEGGRGVQRTGDLKGECRGENGQGAHVFIVRRRAVMMRKTVVRLRGCGKVVAGTGMVG